MVKAGSRPGLREWWIRHAVRLCTASVIWNRSRGLNAGPVTRQFQLRCWLSEWQSRQVRPCLVDALYPVAQGAVLEGGTPTRWRYLNRTQLVCCRAARELLIDRNLAGVIIQSSVPKRSVVQSRGGCHAKAPRFLYWNGFVVPKSCHAVWES